MLNLLHKGYVSIIDSPEKSIFHNTDCGYSAGIVRDLRQVGKKNTENVWFSSFNLKQIKEVYSIQNNINIMYFYIQIIIKDDIVSVIVLYYL